MVRKPVVAGQFYPASKSKLEAEVKTLLSISDSKKSFNNILGIVSPHAGYIYSGRTAAYGFNLLKDKNIETVIIISPSHREYFPGVSVYEGDAYETPLGVVEVNKEIVQKLTEESKIIFKGIEGHREEHAVEVQIPFLQIVLEDFKIVPIVIGDQGDLFVNELAEKCSLSVSYLNEIEKGKKEAKACEGIKNTLLQKGYTIPLVADIHFYLFAL